MRERSGEKIRLTSYEELLGISEEEGSVEIEIDRITGFENHPFKVLDDERMDELVDSIRRNGVLTPVLVRQDDENGYEMISGHRRMHAARLAGLTTIPAIIRELTDDEATIVMVDSNIQREEILPSEKAFAYRMKLEAMRHQGQRTDLICARNGHKSPDDTGDRKHLRSRDILAEQTGDSKSQISRYIRLTELIPELLKMVDEKRLALSVAVELSYLDHQMQRWVNEYIHENGMIKREQLAALRQYREHYSFTQEEFIAFLNENLAVRPSTIKITLSEKKLHQYFPAYYSLDEMERVVTGLLENWKAGNPS